MNWISTKDSLPENGQPVLFNVVLEKLFPEDIECGASITIGIFKDGYFYADDTGDSPYLKDVTHWIAITPPIELASKSASITSESEVK